jgi:sterol desaturase/sphingolipid hydroxylase (fatty acid hydroxylase superfamily)
MHWEQIEADSYWVVFAAGFLAVALWESRSPNRNLSSEATRRWTRHGTVLFVTAVFTNLLHRASPIIVAMAMAGSRFSLLNRPWLPYWAKFIFSFVLLDLARYALHWSFHAVPLLWRVHQVHHSDPDFDLSTGVRNHPLESIVAQGALLAIVAILGAPPAAVMAVAAFSVAQSFFTHANASLPGWLERPLRWVFVTPDMHRVHHSEEVPEQSKNLGELFPWWDRIFRTYLESPAAGQERMKFGIKGFQNDECINLSFIFAQPFRSPQEETLQEVPANGD